MHLQITPNFNTAKLLQELNIVSIIFHGSLLLKVVTEARLVLLKTQSQHFQYRTKFGQSIILFRVTKIFISYQVLSLFRRRKSHQ